MNPFWNHRDINSISAADFSIILSELDSAYSAAEYPEESIRLPDYYRTREARQHDAALVGRLLFSKKQDGLVDAETVFRAQLMESQNISHPQL